RESGGRIGPRRCARARAVGHAAGGPERRQFHHRRRRHQRAAVEGGGLVPRAADRRWLCARDLADSHRGRRRHRVRDRDRDQERHDRSGGARRARRRRDGHGRRPRRDAGDRPAEPARGPRSPPLTLPGVRRVSDPGDGATQGCKLMRYRRRMNRLLLAIAGMVAVSAALAAQAAPPASPRATSGLTAVDGIKVGHHTLTERPTGCTVILVDGDAVGGVSQRGGAPGTRETDLLDPLNMVDKVNAVLLAGGSAFGLEAATGTVKWLEEHNIGWPAGPSRVPIVPGAILFDLGVGANPKIRPTAECGYKAAAAATAGPVEEGSVGAGAGATVGKFGGPGRS